MDRWTGRVALVPDARDGVATAIVKALVVEGMNVVAMAPSLEQLQNLSLELKSFPGKIYPIAGDPKKEDDISAAFETALKLVGGVDVLISNVDVYRGAPCTGERMSESDWRARFNENLQAFKTSTRCLLKCMQVRQVDDGHIVYINTMEKYRKSKFPNEATYYASKYGFTAIIKGLRHKFFTDKSRIRITTINIGAVLNTVPSLACNAGDGEGASENQDALRPKDVADAVTFALGAPAHVQVQELNVKSIGEK